MLRVYRKTYRPLPVCTLSCCLLLLCGDRLWALILAQDDASQAAYSLDVTGAWKGTSPTANENPPGADNGGSGFEPWNFAGGYHQPQYSPYGNLNHFIDGTDFTSSSYNNLGAPAFALTNSNFDSSACGVSCTFGGETSRATRSFASPLAPGDTLKIDFDNPLLTREVAWSPAGFLIRLNAGAGPVISGDPSSGTERFGIFAESGVYSFPGLFGNNWAVADNLGNTNTGVAVNSTAVGTELQFMLVSEETYSLQLTRLSDGQILFSRSGSLSHSGEGAIDSIEIALYGNGSGNGLVGGSMQATGEREFYFDNLRIERAEEAIPGDYNRDGKVDAADYVVWRAAVGEFVSHGTGADGDSNGEINFDDYTVWRVNFGKSSDSQAMALSTVVPEPGLLAQLLLVILAWYRGFGRLRR